MGGTEVAFVLVIPAESVLPLSLFTSDALAINGTNYPLYSFATTGYLQGRCDAAQDWARAKAFFHGSSLELTGVNAVVGGWPAVLGNKYAMVVDKTIYFDRGMCP